MRYAVRMTPDDNGTVLVTCPDLPEVTTFGEDADEARRRAVDAIETAIQGRIADRDEIPDPVSSGEAFAELPMQSALKVALYRALRADGVRKAELARRLGWKAPQVDRLFDLRHASRIDQIEAAFHALGRRLEVKVEAA